MHVIYKNKKSEREVARLKGIAFEMGECSIYLSSGNVLKFGALSTFQEVTFICRDVFTNGSEPRKRVRELKYVPKEMPGGGVRAFGPDTAKYDPLTKSGLAEVEMVWSRFYDVIEYFYLQELEGNL